MKKVIWLSILIELGCTKQIQPPITLLKKDYEINQKVENYTKGCLEGSKYLLSAAKKKLLKEQKILWDTSNIDLKSYCNSMSEIYRIEVEYDHYTNPS